MYSKFQLAKKYLYYYFTASNGKGHGIHSPFVFEFVQQVLNDNREFYAYRQIEYLRYLLRNDKRVIEVKDLGAGSAISNHRKRAVSDIAKHAAKSEKLGQLLFRIANYYQPKNLIELGTSLGISSAYLASACPNASVITIEGSENIADLANENFRFLGLKNIHSLTGHFDDMLPKAIKDVEKIDLAFIDGNHQQLPTLSYFEKLLGKAHEYSIFIFDDIHWSSGMEEAWKTIRNYEKVSLTIDLFFLGLVFFRKDFKAKQDFIIRF